MKQEELQEVCEKIQISKNKLVKILDLVSKPSLKNIQCEFEDR
tara:strand:+ start:450 stop:578 length:129 start_codon:yes stop_codon:yes gene_type:complete